MNQHQLMKIFSRTHFLRNETMTKAVKAHLQTVPNDRKERCASMLESMKQVMDDFRSNDGRLVKIGGEGDGQDCGNSAGYCHLNSTGLTLNNSLVSKFIQRKMQSTLKLR